MFFRLIKCLYTSERLVLRRYIAKDERENGPLGQSHKRRRHKWSAQPLGQAGRQAGVKAVRAGPVESLLNHDGRYRHPCFGG